MSDGESDRLVYLRYRAAAAALRALPRPLASAAGRAAGLLYERRKPATRAIVAANLRRVLGPGASSADLDRVVDAAFAAYGAYWCQAARLRPNDAALLQRRFRIDGAEHLLTPLSQGRGVVLALPHLGTWEAGAVWAAAVGHPLTTVAEPLSPPELFSWFVGQREALGLEVLPLGGSTGAMLAQTLRAGRPVALLADRDIVGDGVEVSLFGEKTRLPAGPAVLAMRSGADLCPCVVYDEPGDRHHAVIRPPIDTSRAGRFRDEVPRITQDLAHALEDLIRARPEQWHVFQPNWPEPTIDV